MMKHRDHYSHSVYVFLIGLAIYRNHAGVRAAYNRKYALAEGPQAACHFLEYWGLASLFHDIGYPFEIAHQQMKAYVCKLFSDNDEDEGFAPYVSYCNIDRFASTRLGDLNELYARAIAERLGENYLARIGCTEEDLHGKLLDVLRDRAVRGDPSTLDYLWMDHAYEEVSRQQIHHPLSRLLELRISPCRSCFEKSNTFTVALKEDGK